jgi:DNA-binding NarL/FixJ family response regulator
MNILIVDDHPLVQEILHSVAREVFTQARFHTAASCAEAVEKARAAEPLDLVMLDLGLPDCDGIDTLKRFRKAQPKACVVVFSDVDDPACMLAAMQGGASGFLLKTLTRPVISAALRLVAAGGTYMPPQAMEAQRRMPARTTRRRNRDLTHRQLDVLRLIVKGLANKQIAQRLRIAEDTVKQHASAAYAVLGVSSRTQAMTAAARRGIRSE